MDGSRMSGEAPVAAERGSVVPPSAPAGAGVAAVRNAAMLGASLAATWSVALVVRLFLPRSLGPTVFGEFNFADVLAANAFGFIGLGLDTYIQKETPARPTHTSEFLGGALLVRLVMSMIIFGALWLAASGRSPTLGSDDKALVRRGWASSSRRSIAALGDSE